MSAFTELKQELSMKSADATRLHDLARELEGNIVRGDMMIGILPLEAPKVMIDGLRRAAELGADGAWLDLARNLTRNPEVAPDPPSALDAFRKAAATGSREARLALASHIYYEQKDPKLADEARVQLDALLANDTDGQATVLLGHFHSQGFGVPKSVAKSLELHRQAAERGNANAMFELSVLLAVGEGVPHDAAQARQWLVKAAEAGHPRATYNMGAFAATGNGMKQDFAEAVKWYRKSSDAGNGRASFTLAMMTMNGEGVEADELAATEFFELARSQGFDVDGALGA